MMRAMQYAFDEAIRSLWRGRRSGLLSTATIALALLVLGAFLVLTANLERLGAEWSSAAEVSVYLKDDITPAEQRAVADAVAPRGLIVGNEFVSKADALLRFKQTFGDLASAVDSLGENPLPASFEVRLGPGADAQSGAGSAGSAGSGGSVDALAASLRQLPGVSDVRYDRQWLSRAMSAIRVIRSVGFVLGLVLTFAAALTVANVVRLALYARREELEIMQLVGAPQAYIRGPFVMEGVLQGGIGAVAALVALAAAFFVFRARYLAPLASAINLTTIRFLSFEMCALLVLGGMAVGCVGGLVAAWQR